MKTVEWTDAQGYNHRALIRDSDMPSVAHAGHGISADPPDVNRIDWEQVKHDLHNLLLAHKLITFDDVNTSAAPLGAVLIKALKAQVIQLYKEQ
jgi:hypothetical protein